MTLSPVLPVIVPMLTAAFLAGLRPFLKRWMVDLLAVLAAGGNLALTLLMLLACMKGNIVVWFGNWFPRGHMVLGIGFEVDPLGASLSCLASLLVLLALIYSWRLFDSGLNLYQPLMLIFLAAMCGFSMTADLFNLFVFFELMSIAAFSLCGLKTQEPAPLQGSFNFAITNTVGAFLILIGIALLYAVTGALNMAQIGLLLGSRHDSLVTAAAAFLISGFLIKAAAAPFHFWLPDAHAVAPTSACVLFSGLMVELGAFAVLRLTTVMFGQSMIAPHGSLRSMLLFIASVTVIWGGVMCFAQHHLKRILAFSTISHGGAMLLGIALATPQAFAGWLAYLFAHAMAKAGLFFLAGILLHRLRSMSETSLFSRGRRLRWTAAFWLLGGVALAGMPPFGLAVGEDLIDSAASSHALYAWLSFLFIFAGTMTAATIFRVFLRVFIGLGDRGPTDRGAQVDELPESNEQHRLIPARMFVPASLCIVLSAAPFFIRRVQVFIFAAAHRAAAQSLYIHKIYSQPTYYQLPTPPEMHLGAALVHGSIALAAAFLLAFAAVSRIRLPRLLRVATRLEGDLYPFRQLQSGHPGDYVVWCMLGFVVVGACLFLLP